MKIKIYEDRSYSRENFSNEGTENENLATTLYFQFPETVNGVETSTLNKYIVFDINGEPNTDILTSNNSYSIPTAITQLGTVSFNIYLVAPTNNGEDSPFRWISKKITLNFNDANDMTEIVITVEEINIFNSLLSELNSAIANIELLEDDFEEFKKDYDELKDDFEEINRNYQAAISQVENVNIDAIKTGSTATVTITNKEGTEKTVEIQDGTDYIITQNDYQEIANIVEQDITPLIPTKLSQLENDSAYIKKEVNNLTNYYKKDETYTKQEVDNKVASVYKYKGTVATYADLPSSNLTIGDVYNVESDGSNYAWDGTAWDKLGGEVDLSDYYTKSQTNTLLNAKQNTIDNSNKLSADLVDDTSTTHKFTSISEKSIWNAKYDKPSGGIPKADLESNVQTSLGKADTAVQNTDYATSNKGGVIKTGGGYGSDILNGALRANEYSYEAYPNVNRNAFISKGTLENVISGKQLINQSTLNESQEEQDAVIQNLKTKNEMLINDHVPITAKNTEIQLTGIGDLPMELIPYGNISQGDLPSEYQQVEYIESTGTQYIDTGINADSNLKFNMDIQFSEQGEVSSYNTFGAILAPTYTRCHITAENNTSITLLYANDLSVSLFTNKNYTTRFSSIIDFKNHTANTNVDGTTVSSNLSTNSFDLGVNFHLFRRNSNDNNFIFYAYVRIFSFKIYDNEVLVRNFIPCYRKSDNVIGMYDLVNDVFYTNAGTGTFTKGNDTPNTNTPIAVKVVDGEYEILAENKNLFNKNNVNNIIQGFFSDKTLTQYSITKTFYMPCVPNTTYVVSKISSTRFDVATTSQNIEFGIVCDNKISSPTSTSITITSGVNDKYLLCYYYNTNSDTLTEEQIRNSIQVEKGSIATSYIAHAEQNVTIDTLPNPLYSENDCYKYLTSEQATALGLNSAGWYAYNKYANQDFANGISSVTIDTMKSNGTFYSTVGGTVSETTITFDGTTTGIGNIIYELATPTYTKITNSNLIISLEALKDMQSYYNVTNISQTHNTSQVDMKIQANALKSLKAMQSEIDSLDARLTLVED